MSDSPLKSPTSDALLPTTEDSLAKPPASKGSDGDSHPAKGGPSPSQGVLTQAEIEALALIVVDDIEYQSQKCCGPASYDFRLGDEFYIPTSAQPEPKIQSCAANGGILTIPPFSSALISTFENVRLPNNVVGRFDLRIGWALSGLVFQMGTQIEPGYYGKLFGLLHNMTDRPKRIRFRNEDDRPLTAEFHYTSTATATPITPIKPLVNMVDFLKEDMVSGSIATLASSAATQSELMLKRLESQSNEVTRLAKELQGLSHNKLSIFLLVATLLLSIVLPIVITRFTYDRGAMPLSTLLAVDTLRKEIGAGASNAVSEYIRTHPDAQLLEALTQLKAKRRALAALNPSHPDVRVMDAEIRDIIDRLSR